MLFLFVSTNGQYKSNTPLEETAGKDLLDLFVAQLQSAPALLQLPTQAELLLLSELSYQRLLASPTYKRALINLADRAALDRYHCILRSLPKALPDNLELCCLHLSIVLHPGLRS